MKRVMPSAANYLDRVHYGIDEFNKKKKFYASATMIDEFLASTETLTRPGKKTMQEIKFGYARRAD